MVDEPTNELLAAGTMLADKYEIVCVLGQGGMGVVYEARHTRLGHRVAIKTITRQAGAHAELIKRFEREARAAAQLSSPHVARINDVENMADGTPFIVMEYLEGNDLDAELAERGHIPCTEAVDYVLQACSAMSEAHEMGIVHRDLKPGNLFLAKKGDTRRVKVLDFGISKVAPEGEVRVTATTSSLGTPMYMSPEQIRSAKHVDGRSDVWALGVILYEMIAGLPPFKGESATAVIAAITADTPLPLSEWEPDVPPALEEAIMRALNKNADERYPNIEAFVDALSPFGSGMQLPRSSLKSLPAIPPSVSSAPTMSSAVTELSAPSGGWAAPEPAAPATSRRGLVGALVAGGLAVVAAVVWLSMSSDGDAVPSAHSAAAVASSAPVSVAATTATEPTVAPSQSAPSAAPATSESPPEPPSPPKPPATRPRMPTPKAQPPKPAPHPRQKPLNPVHL